MKFATSLLLATATSAIKLSSHSTAAKAKTVWNYAADMGGYQEDGILDIKGVARMIKKASPELKFSENIDDMIEFLESYWVNPRDSDNPNINDWPRTDQNLRGFIWHACMERYNNNDPLCSNFVLSLR